MSAPYYPYRANKAAGILIAILIVVYCIFFGYIYRDSLTHNFSFCVFVVLFALLSFWALKTGFATSKIRITCDSDCIHIYEKNVQHSISWNDLTNKYRVRSFFKGHEYLILSHCELHKSDIKKVIREDTLKSQVCLDHYYVIYLDQTQPQLVQELERYIDANMGQKANEGVNNAKL